MKLIIIYAFLIIVALSAFYLSLWCIDKMQRPIYSDVSTHIGHPVKVEGFKWLLLSDSTLLEDQIDNTRFWVKGNYGLCGDKFIFTEIK